VCTPTGQLVLAHTHACAETEGAFIRPRTRSCVCAATGRHTLTHTYVVCRTRAACPCAHSCVCRSRLVRSHARVHTRVCAVTGWQAPVHTYAVCRNWASAFCTSAHSLMCVHNQGGALVRTPPRTLTMRIHRQGQHARAHTHPHTRILVCVDARGCVGAPAHTLMCVWQQGSVPLHTLMLCADAGDWVCTPAHTLMCAAT
jgi:hypothetical protein